MVEEKQVEGKRVEVVGEEEATKSMRLRPSMGSKKLTMQLDLTDC